MHFKEQDTSDSKDHLIDRKFVEDESAELIFFGASEKLQALIA